MKDSLIQDNFRNCSMSKKKPDYSLGRKGRYRQIKGLDEDMVEVGLQSYEEEGSREDLDS